MLRLIQADDLTGSADSAARFASAGLHTVVAPWSDEEPIEQRLARIVADSEPDVLSVDTASRDLHAGEAAGRAAAVGRWFAGRREPGSAFYKKVDSTLRGPLRAEVDAVRAELGPGVGLTLVAPAFPELGRTTVAGQQLAHGTPVGGPLAEVLGLGSEPWVALGLEQVRGGGEAVAGLLERHRADGVRWVVADAELPSDLACVADAVARLAVPPLLVGSGGLAGAQADRLRGRDGRWPEGTVANAIADLPIGSSGPTLVVSGSRTPLAGAQVERLVSARPDLRRVEIDAGLATSPAERVGSAVEEAARTAGDALAAGRHALLVARDVGGAKRASTPAVAHTLARAAAAAVRAALPSVVIVNGGETALRLCSQLGVDALRVRGEMAPGAVWLEGPEPGPVTLRLVTKSGSFGHADTLAALVQRTAGEPARAAAVPGRHEQRPRHDPPEEVLPMPTTPRPLA